MMIGGKGCERGLFQIAMTAPGTRRTNLVNPGLEKLHRSPGDL